MTSPSPGVQTEAAASDLMRMIAHELRQPLSTIGSIAYYLTLILPRDDEKVNEQLGRLQQLVEQSSWILTNGQHLTDAAAIAPEPIDIEELLTQTVSMRAGAGDTPVHLELAGNLPLVEADPGLARALIENLLTLFRLLSTLEHPAKVITTQAASGVSIELATSAQGYRSEAMLGPGSALGLQCARRIVELHGGALDLNIHPSGGVSLRLLFPSRA